MIKILDRNYANIELHERDTPDERICDVILDSNLSIKTYLCIICDIYVYKMCVFAKDKGRHASKARVSCNGSGRSYKLIIAELCIVGAVTV